MDSVPGSIYNKFNVIVVCNLIKSRLQKLIKMSLINAKKIVVFNFRTALKLPNV